jgi:hypothetical protein
VCEDYRLNTGGKKVPVRGAGGVLALVMLLENCSRERALAHIAHHTGMSLDAGHLAVIEEDLDDNFQISLGHREAPEIAFPPFTHPIYGTLPYLRKRGITEEEARNYGIGYCESGQYAQRLVFPVYEQARLVYWQARATWEAAEDLSGPHAYRKSLNPPAWPGAAGAGDVLMNLDTAKTFPRVAIVEGPIDAVHAGPSAVCTFGKKISPLQIQKLYQAGVRSIDLMWDGPSPREPHGAWPEMVRAARLLAGVFRDVRLVFLPMGDPGDWQRGQLDWFRMHAARSAASVSGLAAI